MQVRTCLEISANADFEYLWDSCGYAYVLYSTISRECIHLILGIFVLCVPHFVLYLALIMKKLWCFVAFLVFFLDYSSNSCAMCEC